MQAQVRRCAREITGDDRPRKLDPALRDKVQYRSNDTVLTIIIIITTTTTTTITITIIITTSVIITTMKARARVDPLLGCCDEGR